MMPRSLPTFAPTGSFQRAVRAAVEEHLATTGAGHYTTAIYWKSLAITAVAALCYASYLLVPLRMPSIMALAAVFGLVLAGIGFNIQHDGSHQSFSRSRFVNRLASFSLDVLGGSSYLWRWKHNVYHHTFPNVEGADGDIELRGIGRLSTAYAHRWFFRYQQWYLWLIYGLVPVKWHFYDDFSRLLRRRSGRQPTPRPRGVELFLLIVGKVVFFLLAFVIPATVHRPATVITFYFISSLTLGWALSIVIQLGHCVEETTFTGAGQPLPHDWAVHQLSTSADFARSSRFVNWYFGGLNYQIEHHLFPGLPHTCYPVIAPTVERVCSAHGIPYIACESLWQALRSHYRFLKKMGASSITSFRGEELLPDAPGS